MFDPVPPGARVELGRLTGRWHRLPLGQALPHAGTVRELAQRYADRAAAANGAPSHALPDLGPAAAMDQLAVTVYDLCLLDPPGGDRGASGTSAPTRPSPGVVPDLAGELAELRRRLD